MFFTVVTHGLTCNVGSTGIAPWAFIVFPVLLASKIGILLLLPEYSSVFKKLSFIWNIIFYSWTIIALIYHSIFLRWSLTELLFLGSIIYVGAVVKQQKYFSKLFNLGLIALIAIILTHHLFSIDSTDFTYSHPSGTIMTIGILIIMGLLHNYIEIRVQIAQQQKTLAEDKTDTLIQLISELSEALKNPIQSVKIKADIMKLREGFSDNMEEMKLELNAIFKLFQRLEQSVKAEYTKENSLNLIEELDYDVPTQVVQLCDEPLGSSPKEVRFIGAILDLIFDETSHLNGISPELKLYLSEARAHISIEFRSEKGINLLEGQGLADVIKSNREVLNNLGEEINYVITITNLRANLLQLDIHPSDLTHSEL